MGKKNDDVGLRSRQMDLLRAAIGSAQVKEVDWADKLQGEERLNFLKYCATTFDNPFFLMAINSLMWANIVKAGTVAETIEQVFNNRAAVDGISQVQEFFFKYSNRYKDEYETESEPVDPHSSFEPVGKKH